jgi:hypothetical protein
MFWLVGTEERRRQAEPRVLELVEQMDAASLASVLDMQGLLPLVGTRLEQLAPDLLPAGFRDTVRAAVKIAGRRATLYAAVTVRVAEALEAAGIPVVPLKGPLLAADIYEHPGMRESQDIDVLVTRETLDAAVAELRRHGWEPAPAEHGEPVPQLHRVLNHARPEMPTLEVHWRIHWYETRFSSSVVAKSRLVPRRGRRPTLPDELVALLLFYCRDGFVGLRYAADIAAWWDANRHSLEPNALDPLLMAHPELVDALLTSLHVAHTVTGVPFKRLTSLPLAGTVRSGMAERLTDWTIHESTDQVGANLTLVDWLLCPPGAQRDFIRRTLVPPRETIRRMYRLADDATFSPLLWQVAHGPKILLRYSAAMWAIRGKRRWTPLPRTHPDGLLSS